jgi:hypothetical protein
MDSAGSARDESAPFTSMRVSCVCSSLAGRPWRSDTRIAVPSVARCYRRVMGE